MGVVLGSMILSTPRHLGRVLPSKVSIIACQGLGSEQGPQGEDWVAVKEIKPSYHHQESPVYVCLILSSFTATQKKCGNFKSSQKSLG